MFVKHEYFFGDGSSSTEAAPQHTFHTPGIYWVKQKLLGTTGCVTSDSVKITVYQGFQNSHISDMQNATVTGNTVKLNWHKHFSTKQYMVQRKSASDTNYTTIAVLNDASEFSDSIADV